MHRPIERIERFAPAATAALLLALSTPAGAAETVDQTLSAAPDASIEIESLSGSLVVRGWDRNEVRVEGSLGDDTEGLLFTSEGRMVRVEVEIPDERGRRRRDVDARLVIDVPRGASVDAETVSASIEVEGVAGDLELESVSGGFDIRGTPRSADLETVSGTIRIDGATTRVTAETVSGSVLLDGAKGELDLSTVSGRIEVSAGEVRMVELEAVSGGIEFTGRLAANARFDAESHSGNVTLRLPADTSAEFEVSTFSGNIDNDLGPAARREGRYTPEKILEFSTGSGSAKVSVETFSGNVALRRH